MTYSISHENSQPLTSDTSITQRISFMDCSRSQSNTTGFIAHEASLGPSHGQYIPSEPREVPSGLTKQQVCFGMVGRSF